MFTNSQGASVDGYDDDPRALVSIPEVKRFFRAVDGHWSHWLHFLIPEVSQIQLILLMLVDVKEETVQNGHIGFSLTSPQQLDDQIQRLLAAMETLHDAFKVPRAHAELMIAAVVRQFCRSMGQARLHCGLCGDGCCISSMRPRHWMRHLGLHRIWQPGVRLSNGDGGPGQG